MCPLHLNRNAWPIATFVLCCYHCSLVGIRLCSIPQETVPSYLPSNVFCHVQHARRTMPKKKKKKNIQHMISKFLPMWGPLVCHNAALYKKKKKAIRVVCGNGWHMWTLASVGSVFNLTQFQSTFSNRWASLRDYTWPPGQPRPLPQKPGIQIAAEWSVLFKWASLSRYVDILTDRSNTHSMQLKLHLWMCKTLV